MQYVLIDDQTRVHVESDSVIGKTGHIVIQTMIDTTDHTKDAHTSVVDQLSSSISTRIDLDPSLVSASR